MGMPFAKVSPIAILPYRCFETTLCVLTISGKSTVFVAGGRAGVARNLHPPFPRRHDADQKPSRFFWVPSRCVVNNAISGPTRYHGARCRNVRGEEPHSAHPGIGAQR